MHALLRFCSPCLDQIAPLLDFSIIIAEEVGFYFMSFSGFFSGFASCLFSFFVFHFHFFGSPSEGNRIL